ncbi:hypothetical protein [Variovorax sp. efr-133-TYG-130]|uniref:hypothetical protein n=1 Tax=Variovorax sp. efr-133-TYG-130 TaxID=3040327 RepID=UPI0025526445|nr:hypothetical protein [Variovorax sp. efr-133-TYG-130]
MKKTLNIVGCGKVGQTLGRRLQARWLETAVGRQGRGRRSSRVEAVAKMTGMVNAESDFLAHAQMIKRLLGPVD